MACSKRHLIHAWPHSRPAALTPHLPHLLSSSSHSCCTTSTISSWVAPALRMAASFMMQTTHLQQRAAGRRSFEEEEPMPVHTPNKSYRAHTPPTPVHHHFR